MASSQVARLVATKRTTGPSSQRMNILMICAPRRAQSAARASERDLREYQSVRADMSSMYEYCLRPEFGATVTGRRGRKKIYSSRVNITRVLVSNPNLKPSKDVDELEDSEYDAEVIESKQMVREAVRDFLLESADDPGVENLMIYFSGHGIHEYNHHLGHSEEAIVVGNDMHYKDSELTSDINSSLPKNKRLYLVIDACHAEGMLNLWQLSIRLNKPVVLFAGASTELNADYTSSDGGLFTQAFVQEAVPGRELSDIQEAVFQQLVEPHARREPVARYGDPQLQVRPYLQ